MCSPGFRCGLSCLGTVLKVRSPEDPDGWGDLVLIKALPWDGGCGNVGGSGGPCMMDVSGKWTGHSHNGQSPLMVPLCTGI